MVQDRASMRFTGIYLLPLDRLREKIANDVANGFRWVMSKSDQDIPPCCLTASTFHHIHIIHFGSRWKFHHANDAV